MNNFIEWNGDSPTVNPGKGDKVFKIPVQWLVTENIEVRANTLKEALQIIAENNELIPCGIDPSYVDGTWTVANKNNKLITEENTSEFEQEILDWYGKDYYESQMVEDYEEDLDQNI